MLHSDTAVERSFFIYKQHDVGNLEENSFNAQRAVFGFVHAVHRLATLTVTNIYIHHVRRSISLRIEVAKKKKEKN